MATNAPGGGPRIADDALVASTAVVSGDVTIGPGCVIDHGAVIVASGGPVLLGERVVVMPGAVIRSTGGGQRPVHPVAIGDDCLIGPQAALAGCSLGQGVYVATQVMVFHGAVVGDGCRLGAGSIVHTKARLRPGSRVGMRQFAIPDRDGGESIVTSDLELAREFLAAADFFGNTFGLTPAEGEDMIELHRRSTNAVAAEIRLRVGW